MSWNSSFCLSLVGAAWIAAASSALAQSLPCNAAATPPSFQLPGAAAKAVALDRGVAVIDDIGATRSIIACEVGAGGRFVEMRRWPLPRNFSVSRIETQGKTLLLHSDDGRTVEQLIVLGRGGSESGRPQSSAPVDGIAHDVRRDGNSLILSVRGLSSSAEAGPQPLSSRLTPIGPSSKISTRKVIGADPLAGTSTVFWDEIGGGTRAFVGRFDRSGRLIAGARVPLEKMHTVPEYFVGQLADGRVFHLEVEGGVTRPLILELTAQFADDIKSGGQLHRSIEDAVRATRSRQAPAGRQGEAAPPAPAIRAGEAAVVPDDTFEAAARRIIAGGASMGEAAAAAPLVKRVDVEACADAFRTHQWVLTPGAYSKAGVANACEPEQGKKWRRPNYLDNQVGKTITGVPYCWGCSASLARFDQSVSQGDKLAGHSCTCRSGDYCLRNDVTGVDCSGFVSQCWKSGYYQTSNMGKIADEIDMTDLKTGDAFNLPGNHIRLFMSVVEGAGGDRYRVIEAANGQGAIGRVREYVYSASQLGSYTPIRYRRIVD